jgi:hypothetical protein
MLQFGVSLTREAGFRGRFQEQYAHAREATATGREAAAAECDVHRQLVYEWVSRHPEFADTVKLAQSERVLRATN